MESQKISREGRQNTIAAVIGNVLEWYDFAVYGYFAPIIGAVFFPSDDPTTSLLAAFAVFAVGYIARPVGGAIFGHIGDRIGRKLALTVSIILMGIGTFLIGVLPTFAQIGVSASLLLVALRIVQGVSVGGEYPGSIVFLAEHALVEKRGLVSSWPEAASIVGFLIGSGLGAVISATLGDEAMHGWGWRVPFLLGSAIAVCGVIFRRQMTEPPALAVMESVARFPVVEALRTEWRAILRMISLLLVNSVGFYMIFVYAVSYLTTRMHVSTAKALDINTISLFAMLLITPCAGLYRIVSAASHFSMPSPSAPLHCPGRCGG